MYDFREASRTERTQDPKVIPCDRAVDNALLGYAFKHSGDPSEGVARWEPRSRDQSSHRLNIMVSVVTATVVRDFSSDSMLPKLSDI